MNNYLLAFIIVAGAFLLAVGPGNGGPTLR